MSLLISITRGDRPFSCCNAQRLATTMTVPSRQVCRSSPLPPSLPHQICFNFGQMLRVDRPQQVVGDSADGLFGRISIHLRGATIPEANRPIHLLYHDAVVSKF